MVAVLLRIFVNACLVSNRLVNTVDFELLNSVMDNLARVVTGLSALTPIAREMDPQIDQGPWEVRTSRSVLVVKNSSRDP